ncbi:MAG: GGDEF domain-containing response regulator [Bauldia sp.]|nr:GGDEF domain-containing response regulator [Bauldia sp.]
MPGVGGDPLRILLVEDNPGDRRLADIALKEGALDAQMRIELLAVGTLAECIGQLSDAGKRFSAVLLDLGLPDAKGLDGLRAARAANPDVPIVVLTGLSDLATATDALNCGASDYLDKAEVQPRPLLRSIRYAIERKRSEGELVRLASTDPLTGLLNRRAFFDELERTRLNALRSELAFAVIILDIDRFKQINDLFGHRMGDDLLIAVAEGLRSHVRSTDCVARIGGDEFAVLATHLKSAEGAIEIAEKIAAVVRSIGKVNQSLIKASVSVGISVVPFDDSEAEELVSHADAAMYKSKLCKRGSVSYFDADMDATIKGRQALKKLMPEDIANGRFFLHFQPIVDAQARTIVAAEALARWRDRQDRPVPPSDFIPLAEESGLIVQLSARLFEDACVGLARWRDAGLPVVPISLNVSPVQFRDPAFGPRLIATIEKIGISPKLINIEIIESSIIIELERA